MGSGRRTRLSSAGRSVSNFMADQANCSKWIAAMARPCASVSRRAAHSQANTTLYFRCQTPSASRSSCSQLEYVFADLQIAGFHPAALVGWCVPAASLHAYVRAQPVGCARRGHGSPVELGQLQNPVFESAVRRSAPSHDAHRRFRDGLLAASRLSPCVLPGVSGWRAKGAAVSARRRSVVGQLPCTRLRLEDNSWQRRRVERLLAISASHTRTGWILPVQPFRRRSYAHAHLHALRFSAHLCRARAHSPAAHRGLTRSRRQLLANFLACDSSTLNARLACWRNVCIRSFIG